MQPHMQALKGSFQFTGTAEERLVPPLMRAKRFLYRCIALSRTK